MVRETGVQSQVESYQRLKKWLLMPTCLTLSIIRWRSRVKWSNPGNGVTPSPTPRCSSYWKAFGSPSTNVANFTYWFSLNSYSQRFWKVYICMRKKYFTSDPLTLSITFFCFVFLFFFFSGIVVIFRFWHILMIHGGKLVLTSKS